MRDVDAKWLPDDRWKMSPSVVLPAGGRSRRMGADKRFLEVEGRPQIVRAFEAALRVSEDLFILAPEEDRRLLQAAVPEARLLYDAQPAAGPLAAVASAMEFVLAEWVCLFAADYPRMTGQRLAALADLARRELPEGGAWIPVVDGQPHYLCAFYDRVVGTSMRTAVEKGCRSFRDWLAAASLPVVWADEAVWGTRVEAGAFVNWNAPEDWS